MSTYGYIKLSHSEYMKLDKKAKASEMKVDLLLCDIITSNNRKMFPAFYDLQKNVKENDTIVIESIENLGLSENNLYQFLDDMIGKSVKVYSAKDKVELTLNKQIKVWRETKKVTKQIQMEGIKKAQENGVKFGREIQYATDEKQLDRVMHDYYCQFISWKEAATRLGIENKTTFYYRYHKWEKETGKK